MYNVLGAQPGLARARRLRTRLQMHSDPPEASDATNATIQTDATIQISVSDLQVVEPHRQPQFPPY